MIRLLFRMERVTIHDIIKVQPNIIDELGHTILLGHENIIWNIWNGF